MRYLSADEIAEAFEAYRNGIALDRIAGHLRITVAELRLVLGLPALKYKKPLRERSGFLFFFDQTWRGGQHSNNKRK